MNERLISTIGETMVDAFKLTTEKSNLTVWFHALLEKRQRKRARSSTGRLEGRLF